VRDLCHHDVVAEVVWGSYGSGRDEKLLVRDLCHHDVVAAVVVWDRSYGELAASGRDEKLLVPRDLCHHDVVAAVVWGSFRYGLYR
jgi:hypothetical protein